MTKYSKYSEAKAYPNDCSHRLLKMSTGRKGFRSRSAALRWLSTALIMSAIRTNFTGKAARGTETRSVAPLSARRTTNQRREGLSHQNFWRRSGNAGSNEGLFQAEFEFADTPRYDQKDNLDGP